MPDALTVSELIDLAKKHPLKWFVPEVVLEDAVHVFHGAEETYKTMLTLQLHEALALGTRFLGRKVPNRHRTGIVQLEMKPRQFAHRLAAFFTVTMPEIAVLPETLRDFALGCKTPRERIEVIADWAAGEELDFISIDSISKLFPPGFDTNEQTSASDVFNQLQRLPTSWLLAHDRKPFHGLKAVGNDEIVGSGRFKQDPDIVHQMVRPDARAPVAHFHWGKMRAGEKPEPVPLYFDHVEYRLFPFHPYLHLLERKAMSGVDLVAEAETRFGWKERRAREYLESLKELIAAPGKLMVVQSFKGHAKVFEINKSSKFAVPLTIPTDLVQSCSKVGGNKRGASLAEAAEE